MTLLHPGLVESDLSNGPRMNAEFRREHAGADSCERGSNTVHVSLRQFRLSAVLHLCRLCSPSTVTRRVWAVAVNAIERESVWAVSHVAKKRGEVRLPFVAHRDSATAVLGVVLVLWVVAATLGVTPGLVGSRPSRAVAKLQADGVFALKAPATARVALTQLPSKVALRSTAHARALPQSAARRDAHFLDDRQPAEGLTNGNRVGASHSLDILSNDIRVMRRIEGSK